MDQQRFPTTIAEITTFALESVIRTVVHSRFTPRAPLSANLITSTSSKAILAAATVYEFTRAINHTIPKGFSCGHTVSTEMVLDRGYVHLLVTENPDGTLNLNFSAIPK